MKRIFAYLSIVLPIILLLYWQYFPQLDPVWDSPILHFYIVTFFTFAAVVVSLFVGRALEEHHPNRHRLLATAFAVMGALFFIHGVTTPGAILFTFNPGVSWAAWLTLFMGGLVFTLASLDRPGRPFLTGRLKSIHSVLLLFCSIFGLIVALRPQWLHAIDQLAGPWHVQFVFYLTAGLWLWSFIVLLATWWETRATLDGIMTLIAAWMFISAISLHRFPLWQFSWWIYHVELLIGAIVAFITLIVEYEQLRRFRLIDYFGALSLLATALLALVASFLIGYTAQRNLVLQISSQNEALSRNLLVNLSDDLPEMATASDLQALADQSMLFEPATWDIRLAELGIGLLILYDATAEPLFAFPESDLELDAIGLPAEGQASRLFTPNQQLYDDAPLGSYLQSFIPITQADETIGYLSLFQAVPGLERTVVTARLQGLLLAGSAMGILLLILLVIVQRADRLILMRTGELEQAYADLRASEALRTDLADMVVHDLRTPLTAISLNLDLLQRSVGKPERLASVRRFIADGQESVQRMLRMISQILDVNRIEAGQIVIQAEPLDINRLLHQKVAQFNPEAELSQKRIILMPPTTLAASYADEELISRVLDNLITNSLKYTARQGEVRLRVTQQGEEIVVQVHDDGEGMSPEVQELIFDKHFQARDADGNPLRRGKGLGLTFCKLAVEAHGGRIWVTSEPGNGSIFHFSLPTAPQTMQLTVV